MNGIRKALAVSTITLALGSGVAIAQDHHDDHHDDHRDRQRDDHHDNYVRHTEWKKGYHMNRNDWNRGERVDYRTYHLNAPPRGYEWRRVDGNYVLAGIATGIVASAIVASSIH